MSISNLIKLSLDSTLNQGFVAAPVRCIYFEIKGQPTYHTSSFKFSLKEGKYNLTLNKSSKSAISIFQGQPVI